MSRLLFAVLFFFALTTPPWVAADTAAKSVTVLESPTVGEIDKRAYRNIVLANGMKVLLISDPQTDKAAAALDVAVGSGDDPQSRQGLAHFLEHMLFLGTRKYPQAGEYQAFISDNGGSHNAFTSLEHTNYFFDVDPQQLQPALDRFSQFFIEPLFNEAYVDREKNAVHSEYQARIRDDSRREWDVMRELFHEKNPAAKFSVGSLSTLADKPDVKVREDLLAFYQQHYSANIMTLVVLGRESLPELQAMVQAAFSAVPDRQRTIDRSAKPVFRDGLLPGKVLLQSNQDERHLQLLFPLPAMQPFYRVKPDAYVSYLLGHEGQGSLFSILKQRGWAETLVAGTDLSNRFAAAFAVDIKLTEEGYRHVDDIAALFFQAVDELKANGVTSWRYDEQKALADLSFRFQEKQDPQTYVSQLANNLQYFPPQDVLRGSFLMEGINPDLVNDVLARLAPGNALWIVSAPDITGDKTSEFYHTPYKIETVALQARSLSGGSVSDIRMPAKNIYIADKLKNKSAPLLSAVLPPSPVPEKIVSSDNYSLWFLQDTVFHVPKGSVLVYARSHLASDSVRHAAMTELYVRLLNDHLNPELYNAYLAGMSLVIARRTRGIEFTLNGYSDKQGLLLKTVMDAFQNPVFDEQRFKLLKAQWKDELNNADKQSPYKQLMLDVPVVMIHANWSRKTYLEVLDAITLKDVQAFAQEFGKAIQADVLVYGNFYEAEAAKLAKVVESTVNRSAVDVADVPSRVVNIPPSDQPYLYVDALDHGDTALIKYFQSSADDVVQQVRFMMLAQVLQSPFFHSLRTEQQLGYIVGARYSPLIRVPGISFLVQSPSHTPGDVNRRVDEFIQQQIDVINKQDDAWFEQQKQAVLTQLQEKPKNLAEQTMEFWTDITTGYFAFDHRQQQIVALQKMTRQDLLDTYKTVLLDAKRRELLLVSPGKAGMKELTGDASGKYQQIDNPDALKTVLPSYTLP